MPKDLIDKDIFEFTGDSERQALLQIIRELKKLNGTDKPETKLKK